MLFFYVTDTTNLHTCKNGAYDSTEVTYKYNNDPGKMYEKDNVYVFFSKWPCLCLANKLSLESEMFLSIHIDKIYCTVLQTKVNACELSENRLTRFAFNVILQLRACFTVKSFTVSCFIFQTMVMMAKNLHLEIKKQNVLCFSLFT